MTTTPDISPKLRAKILCLFEDMQDIVELISDDADPVLVQLKFSLNAQRPFIWINVLGYGAVKA